MRNLVFKKYLRKLKVFSQSSYFFTVILCLTHRNLKFMKFVAFKLRSNFRVKAWAYKYCFSLVFKSTTSLRITCLFDSEIYVIEKKIRKKASSLLHFEDRIINMY